MSLFDSAHALIIGIANYQHALALPSVVLDDARDIGSLLVDPSHCAYDPANVRFLLDCQATQVSLRKAFTDLTNRTDQDSTLFVYFSGHGGRIESGSRSCAYLLPVDADCATHESLAQTAISAQEFTEALRRIPARKTVVVFDCCHAGGIGQLKSVVSAEYKAGLPASYYETLAHGRGCVVLASSRSGEYSYVLPGAANSLFTQHLLAGLCGGAPGPGGVIRIFDLFHYIQPRVVADQPAQHPVFKAEVEDNFPVALHLGGKMATTPTPTPAPSIDGLTYDVFISYRQQEPDKSWVRKTLLPRLENVGLRVCIDYRSFRLGAPLVTEMARAVEESRYTLSVLTPRYLESNFTELENVLAEHLGLEKSQRRLLAILREACTPRLGMRARLWLDMSDGDEFETDIERLVYELRQPPDK